jgi:hypothetical protein
MLRYPFAQQWRLLKFPSKAYSWSTFSFVNCMKVVLSEFTKRLSLQWSSSVTLLLPTILATHEKKITKHMRSLYFIMSFTTLGVILSLYLWVNHWDFITFSILSLFLCVLYFFAKLCVIARNLHELANVTTHLSFSFRLVSYQLATSVEIIIFDENTEKFTAERETSIFATLFFGDRWTIESWGVWCIYLSTNNRRKKVCLHMYERERARANDNMRERFIQLRALSLSLSPLSQRSLSFSFLLFCNRACIPYTLISPYSKKP